MDCEEAVDGIELLVGGFEIGLVKEQSHKTAVPLED
jgi:hypothetical protein